MVILIPIPFPTDPTGPAPYERPPRGGLIAGSALALIYASLPLTGGFLSKDIPELLGLAVNPQGTWLIYNALAWLSALGSVGVFTALLMMSTGWRLRNTILFCGALLLMAVLIPLQIATAQELMVDHCSELQGVRSSGYIPGCGL